MVLLLAVFIVPAVANEQNMDMGNMDMGNSSDHAATTSEGRSLHGRTGQLVSNSFVPSCHCGFRICCIQH